MSQIFEILIEIFAKLVRDFLWDFLFFNIGRAILLILTIGYFPDQKDLDEDNNTYGVPGGFYFGIHHFMCSIVGAIAIVLIWVFFLK
jgi:hypothetical protein